MVEWSVWKGIWVLNSAFVFFLIMLLWLNPIHTPAAEAYGWFFIGFMGFFIIDLLMGRIGPQATFYTFNVRNCFAIIKRS